MFTHGNYVTYTYDNLGQLTTAAGWEEDRQTSRLQEQLACTYDAGWNLNSRTDNQLEQQFQVNNLSELSSVARSGRLTVANTAGQRRAADHTGGARTVSGCALALLLANLSVITNDCDGVGRFLATHLRTSAGMLSNKHEYIYNPASQRTNETRTDASTVAYRYDPIGQLKVGESNAQARLEGPARVIP